MPAALACSSARSVFTMTTPFVGDGVAAAAVAAERGPGQDGERGGEVERGGGSLAEL